MDRNVVMIADTSNESSLSLGHRSTARRDERISTNGNMRQHVLCGGKDPIQQSRIDPRSLGRWLALVEELVLGEWLAEIILPCR